MNSGLSPESERQVLSRFNAFGRSPVARRGPRNLFRKAALSQVSRGVGEESQGPVLPCHLEIGFLRTTPRSRPLLTFFAMQFWGQDEVRSTAFFGLPGAKICYLLSVYLLMV